MKRCPFCKQKGLHYFEAGNKVHVKIEGCSRYILSNMKELLSSKGIEDLTAIDDLILGSDEVNFEGIFRVIEEKENGETKASTDTGGNS